MPVSPSPTAPSPVTPKVVTLTSDTLALGIVPELGGKIASFIDRRNGHDWMWAPPGPRRFFRNQTTDPFAQSTLIGADECFPTVAACRWQGRDLPDHGELWAVPWTVREHTADTLDLEVQAPLSPFTFRRRLTLTGATVRFNYTVKNTGTARESFLWAFHPLLKFEPGDRIEVPAASARIDSQLNTPFGARGAAIPLPEAAPGMHLDHLDFGPGVNAAVKYFTDTLEAGRVALVRPTRGRRLVFEFDRDELPTLGVWINRGGWAGFRHVALEPTNGAPDPLDVAASWGRCQQLDPGIERSWGMTLRLEPLSRP